MCLLNFPHLVVGCYSNFNRTGSPNFRSLSQRQRVVPPIADGVVIGELREVWLLAPALRSVAIGSGTAKWSTGLPASTNTKLI